MDFMVQVIKQKVNLGDLPYFESASTTALKSIAFHHDKWVDKFPRLRSLTRIEDVLEMNLFLEHRFAGKFMPPKRGGNTNTLGGVSLLTINALAYSLIIYLNWLETHNVAWQEVMAVAGSEKAKYWLPVYRFRKNLIERVENKAIDRDTANLYMNHIRQFYEWAFKQRRIEKIPFEYKTKIIKKKRKDDDFDFLFAMTSPEERGIAVTTTDLLIPKKYKQKKFNDGELAPYNREELTLLYSSNELKKPAPRLWVELAHLCGLRAGEVAKLPATSVLDPSFSNQGLFYVEIVGKFDKRRKVMVSRQLMASLWQFTNNTERQRRLAKWQMEHGDTDNAPLFLNRSGKPILAKSVSNVIAKFMLKKNLPIGFIQYKLMQLLGHSNFSTTQKYINFAQSETFDRQMSSWVDKLFGEHLPSLHEDLLQLQGSDDE